MQNIVNEFNNVNINVKHEVNISKGTIVGIAAIMLITAVVVYGILNFNIFKPNQSLLDISISSNANNYLAGENINYQVYLSNMGSNNRYDATIKYLISDDLSNTITRKEETIAIETTASINRNIQLPTNIKPGKYTLLAIASYGQNEEAKSSLEFEIVTIANSINKNTNSNSNNSTTKNNTNINNSANINTEDNVNTDNIKNQNIKDNNYNTQPQTSVTENTKESFGDILIQIKETTKTNPQTAVNKCEELELNSKKDMCYTTIADVSKIYSYCDKIISLETKDNCYLSFATSSKDICNKITDKESKVFCEQLQIVNQMDKYYKENNTQKVLELSKQFNPEVYSATSPIRTYEYTYTEIATDNIMTSDYNTDIKLNTSIDNTSSNNLINTTDISNNDTNSTNTTNDTDSISITTTE